ncbi:MAG: carboxypeptidase-like regulatory domain-containing protein, partial [Acidobacteriota bacterium]
MNGKRSSLHATFAVCVVLCIALCAPLTAQGQVTTARLEGIVKDQTGGVIPGAMVVVTNTGTNIPYEALTNMVGFFVLPQLLPGTYTVSCEITGFKRSVIQGLRLQVGDTRSVQLILEPGEISEHITVTAEATPVDLTSQNIRSVVQEQQITDLPLNGRNAMNLFFLQAGANPIVAAQSQESASTFNQQHRGNVDGLRVVANNVTVEGIWAQDSLLENGPGMVSLPTPVDALAEYTVVTSSASAEFGRGAGAQV